MSGANALGATPAEWAHFATTLGLGAHLLPCVPAAADVQVLAGSALEGKVGKIPSVFDEQGYAHGLKQWQKRELLPEELAEWSKDARYNICVRTGVSQLYAIDVDVEDKALNDEITQTILDAWPEGQDIEWRVRANSLKFLVPFRMEAQWTKKFFKTNADPTNLDRVELLGVGQQFVAAGTHSSGVRYEWARALPSILPSLSESQATNLWNLLAQKFSTSDISNISDGSTTTADTSADLSSTDLELRTTISDEDWQNLIQALNALQPLAADNDKWSEIGYGLLSLQNSRPARQLWIEFSQGAPNYEAGAPEHWWATHEDQVPRSDFRHIFKLARVQGWRPHLDPSAFTPVPDSTESPAPAPTLVNEIPQAHHLCTDQRNANRLQAWYGKQIVACAGDFYAYDGMRWRRDESFPARCAATLSTLVLEEAKAARLQFETLPKDNALVAPVLQTKRRDQSNAVDKLLASPNGPEILAALQKAEALERWAKQCESATVQQKALTMLRTTHTVDVSIFNKDPMLLNCLNGTIDLRTGTLKPHDALNFITKLVPVNYNPTATAPRWERFMREILGEECAAFMQRFYGYCATGSMTEQCMLVKIGDGKNGKSTETDVISEILGGYCDTAAIGLLTATSDRHSTEVAALFGLRLVTTHESDESAVLREGLIKQLTGGDKVNARYLYGDGFTFSPTCKIQLLTNHRPVIRGADDGVWRRIRLVTYPKQFGTPEEVAAGRATHVRDKNLKESLLAEREGILAWIVSGAMQWYADGLQEPVSVLHATEAYRREQNRVAKWIEECCTLDRTAFSPYSAAAAPYGVYPSYVRWCRESNHQPLNKPNFIARLETEVPGFRRDEMKVLVNGKRRSVNGCYGLRVDAEYVCDKDASPQSAAANDDNAAIASENPR